MKTEIISLEELKNKHYLTYSKIKFEDFLIYYIEKDFRNLTEIEGKITTIIFFKDIHNSLRNFIHIYYVDDDNEHKVSFKKIYINKIIFEKSNNCNTLCFDLEEVEDDDYSSRKEEMKNILNRLV